MARLDSFLRVIVEQGASDLHLSSGCVPAIRRDGELVRLPFRAMSEVETRRFLMEVLTPDEEAALERDQTLDFVHAVEHVARFRGNAFLHAGGVGAVFRIIPEAPPTLDAVGLPPVVRELCLVERGLIFICGPTGAGKTTTLAAMLNEINHTRTAHIITIEDPIEFVHAPHLSVISQRQVGEHAMSYAAAMRAALRESPDVIVVGEMRDAETVGLAIDACEKGVLVLGTLHTNSAAKAIHRITDLFPDARRERVLRTLADRFVAILAERLVKRATGEGRTPILEVLRRNLAVSSLIRDNKVHQIESYLLSPDLEPKGTIGFDQALAHAVHEGLVSLGDAVDIARDPEAFRQSFDQAGPGARG